MYQNIAAPIICYLGELIVHFENITNVLQPSPVVIAGKQQILAKYYKEHLL